MKTLASLLLLVLALPVFAGAPMGVATTNDCWQTNNAIRQMESDIAKYNDYKSLQDGLGQAGAAAGLAKGAADVAKGARDLLDAYKALSRKDQAYDPNHNPPGAPRVPSHCPAGGEACFEAAYGKLNRTRANFERLRAIRGVTEDFVKASLSFGDSVSGVHGVAGIAWQAERRKIEDSFKNFQKIYENKYRELLGVLQQALLEVSECEQKVYGEPDWFNRYGFMYYQFMEARYAW